MNYTQKLSKAVKTAASCLCVGLDPNLERIPESLKQRYAKPEEQVLAFLQRIVDLTAPYCAAFKPNLGFFEALGADGLHVFQKIIDYIPDEKIIIADVKRGDINSTAQHYARAYFEVFDVDAVTLNPLMGFETLNSFLDYPQKGIYTLALTSNPGATDFLMKPFAQEPSMAVFIAKKLNRINQQHATHLGMVAGATKAPQLAPVIQAHPKGSLLIPGIGTQGGSIDEMKSLLKNHEGISLFNSSRSILYAGEGLNNWEQAVTDKAQTFKKALQSITISYV